MNLAPLSTRSASPQPPATPSANDEFKAARAQANPQAKVDAGLDRASLQEAHQLLMGSATAQARHDRAVGQLFDSLATQGSGVTVTTKSTPVLQRYLVLMDALRILKKLQGAEGAHPLVHEHKGLRGARMLMRFRELYPERDPTEPIVEAINGLMQDEQDRLRKSFAAIETLDETKIDDVGALQLVEHVHALDDALQVMQVLTHEYGQALVPEKVRLLQQLVGQELRTALVRLAAAKGAKPEIDRLLKPMGLMFALARLRSAWDAAHKLLQRTRREGIQLQDEYTLADERLALASRSPGAHSHCAAAQLRCPLSGVTPAQAYSQGQCAKCALNSHNNRLAAASPGRMAEALLAIVAQAPSQLDLSERLQAMLLDRRQLAALCQQLLPTLKYDFHDSNWLDAEARHQVLDDLRYLQDHALLVAEAPGAPKAPAMLSNYVLPDLSRHQEAER